MNLTTPLHLAPMLRMSGAMPLLPLYSFMTWTWETLTLDAGQWSALCCSHKYKSLVVNFQVRLMTLKQWRMQNLLLSLYECWHHLFSPLFLHLLKSGVVWINNQRITAAGSSVRSSQSA
jgi:hypothetical protein